MIGNTPLRVVTILLCLIAGTPAFAGTQEVTHHDATATFDPASRQLTIEDRVSLPTTKETAVALADWMTIISAETEGSPVTVKRSGHVWQLSNPAGSMTSVTITASGTVPAMPPSDARRGVRGASADPVEGSFLPGYVRWLPDTGTDHVTYRLQINIKGSQQAVATGRIAGETMTDDGFKAEYVADYPTELPSLFVGPYQVTERVIDGTRIRAYFHEDITGSADHYIEQSADYIRMFAEEIGAYPFDDFHIVSAPLPVGLGFPNLTYIGRSIVPLPFMRGRSLAHEVLHNWWGNGAAIDYRSGNWAEGLTTFQADYGLAERQGADAAREMRLGWLRDYAALPASDDKPVTSFTSKTHQASQIIGYNKPAHILHMLRLEIGADAFYAGLRDFWKTQQFKTASWADLQRSFETVTGDDLGWFFTQWIAQSGAPELHLRDVQTQTTASGHKVSLTLRQAGDAFHLRVPVIVDTVNGRVERTVRMNGQNETFELELENQPLRIQVDPDFDVFRKLLPGESPPIMREISLAPKVDAIVLGNDETFSSIALPLAQRLSRQAVAAKEAAPTRATIVVGTTDEIARYTATHLSAEVPDLAKNGTAAAWTHRGKDGHTVLLIRAEDTAALEGLIRPLPHYGSRSYVTFDGRRAQNKGVWKIEDSPLSVALQ